MKPDNHGEDRVARTLNANTYTRDVFPADGDWFKSQKSERRALFIGNRNQRVAQVSDERLAEKTVMIGRNRGQQLSPRDLAALTTWQNPSSYTARIHQSQE
jgi:hypothetical protein